MKNNLPKKVEISSLDLTTSRIFDAEDFVSEFNLNESLLNSSKEGDMVCYVGEKNLLDYGESYKISKLYGK